MRTFRILIAHAAVIAIGVTTFMFSYSAYREAGEHLTAPSVHVSAYYRRDGSYVSAYNRRPPGGARHDAPYEARRSTCMLGMLAGIFLTVVPLVTVRPFLVGVGSPTTPHTGAVLAVLGFTDTPADLADYWDARHPQLF